MYTLNYESIKALRTNPEKYWNDRNMKVKPSLSILLYAAPELFEEFFIIQMTPPDDPATKMVEEFSRDLNRYLQNHEGITSAELELLQKAARQKHGIDLNKELSSELIAYSKYLNICEDKDIITRETYNAALEQAKRLASVIGWKVTDFQTTSEPPSWLLNGICKTKKENHLQIFNAEILHPEWKKGSKFYKAAMVVNFDVLYVDLEKNKVEVQNIIFTEDVVGFPEYYRRENLNLLSMMQKDCLKALNMEVKVGFRVVSSKTSHIFKVGNFPKLDDELNAVMEVLINGWKLPYEFYKSDDIIL